MHSLEFKSITNSIQIHVQLMLLPRVMTSCQGNSSRTNAQIRTSHKTLSITQDKRVARTYLPYHFHFQYFSIPLGSVSRLFSTNRQLEYLRHKILTLIFKQRSRPDFYQWNESVNAGWRGRDYHRYPSMLVRPGLSQTTRKIYAANHHWSSLSIGNLLTTPWWLSYFTLTKL
jgi:hypothetical protein